MHPFVLDGVPGHVELLQLEQGPCQLVRPLLGYLVVREVEFPDEFESHGDLVGAEVGDVVVHEGEGVEVLHLDDVVDVAVVEVVGVQVELGEGVAVVVGDLVDELFVDLHEAELQGLETLDLEDGSEVF